MPTLEARALRKQYRNKVAVEDVSLEVATGEVVGLLGTNGAGKTTCFYMIVGLLPTDGGDIFLDGKRLTDAPMHKRARAGIGYLPQEASVFRKLAAEDNLMAIIELRRDLTRSEQRRLLERLIDEFHLDGVRSSLGERLSGGRAPAPGNCPGVGNGTIVHAA
jgi:lipopolysaccharide export system ATP-binding protein